MLPRTLRHKLLFLFMMVLVFAFAIMISVNQVFWTQTLEHRDEGLAAVARLVRSVISGIAPSEAPVTSAQRAGLQLALDDLAQSFDGIAWLEAIDGSFVLGSSGITQIPPISPQDVRDLGEVLVSDSPGIRQFEALLSIPVKFAGHDGILRVMVWKSREIRFVIPTMIVVFTAITMVAMLILFAFSSRLVDPLKKLERSALRLAEGDFDHRAESSSMTELAQLAAAFNTMAGNLQRMLNISKHLTANASHELRSPLARISMAEALARQHCLAHNPQAALRSLDSLREEVDGMDQLIQKILDFSKQNYSCCLAMSPCDLVELVHEAVRRFCVHFDSKNITVKVEAPDTLWIDCLRDGILLAMSNLLHNAAKYTSAGGTVRIVLEQTDEHRILKVINTFRQLSENELQTIFQPFTRGTDTHIPGTGLGLAIVSRVMENHNGWAEASNAEMGLCIQLTFADRKHDGIRAA